ncbi:MAG: hypothetical protein HY785_29385 [Oscillatoriophycideae cyanobacterium NC_groundwater_1537_Pr4_S-0.65um_50_18]|nr:hypothetical protein [Oscillatoriophycideae cyanobacterium NC_groundwater_1537_Pr4_S-0.65um_50_18]
MRHQSKSLCYCCEQPATTTEHIPPKCFFPEKKYLPEGSPDYRKNLITVASCEMHNTSRSFDDQYAATCIAMHSDNELAMSIFTSKWFKSLLRRDGSLGKRVFSTARETTILSRENGIFIPEKTLAISWEMKRVEHVIESIARGLYYHESSGKEKWTKSCAIKSSKLLMKDLSKPQDSGLVNQLNQAFKHGEKHIELGLNKKGENPDAFYYQIIRLKTGESYIRMVFYNDFDFLAVLYDECIVPKSIIIPRI